MTAFSPYYAYGCLNRKLLEQTLGKNIAVILIFIPTALFTRRNLILTKIYDLYSNTNNNRDRNGRFTDEDNNCYGSQSRRNHNHDYYDDRRSWHQGGSLSQRNDGAYDADSEGSGRRSASSRFGNGRKSTSTSGSDRGWHGDPEGHAEAVNVERGCFIGHHPFLIDH